MNEKYILYKEVWNDIGECWIETNEYDSEKEALKAFDSLHSSEPKEWRIVQRMDRVVKRGKSRQS